MNVILEGILDKRKYSEMLSDLMREWDENIHIYYYDIPLETTLKRHEMRPQIKLFSKEAMRNWYRLHNELNLPNEHIFDEKISVDEAVNIILQDIAENIEYEMNGEKIENYHINETFDSES